MGKKLHIYDAADVTRSVLEGVKVTANCGLKKVLRREDIDDAMNSPRGTCAGCLQVVGEEARKRDVLLAKPEGWTRHLERQAAPVYTFRMSSNSATWSATFPLAG